jgi:RNA polymerase sigma factor (TIGR02999 family)
VKEKTSKSDITQLLVAWGNGDQDAMQNLAPVIYRELHRLAARYMRRERAGHLLQTTALVNEAYIRLVDWKTVRWQNRAHFLGMAAQIMRRILVDFARTQNRDKRGGGAFQVSLYDVSDPSSCRNADVVALDQALEALASLDPRQSNVVELRFFGGLSLEETAEVLKVSIGTVRRDWSLAKAWLYRELQGYTES